jgi:hypothetical protein
VLSKRRLNYSYPAGVLKEFRPLKDKQLTSAINSFWIVHTKKRLQKMGEAALTKLVTGNWVLSDDAKLVEALYDGFNVTYKEKVEDIVFYLMETLDTLRRNATRDESKGKIKLKDWGLVIRNDATLLTLMVGQENEKMWY